MVKEISIAPSNSLLLIMDLDSGEIPEPDSLDEQRFAATPSCIAIGTLCAVDGETAVVLTDEKTYPESDHAMRLVFGGSILTPQRRIDVCTVELEAVISLTVLHTCSGIEVWTNDPSEPDKICLVVGP